MLTESGRYVVTAENSVGRANAIATVVIGRKFKSSHVTDRATPTMGSHMTFSTNEILASIRIEIVSRPMIDRGVIRVAEGEPLEIECRADGNPAPRIEWFRDRGPSRGDVPAGFTPAVIDRYFVRHPAVSAYNAGEYRCRASNDQASAEQVVRVEGSFFKSTLCLPSHPEVTQY